MREAGFGRTIFYRHFDDLADLLMTAGREAFGALLEAERTLSEAAAGPGSDSEVVRAAIERELWSEFHGRYLRSLADPTVDVSLLGLAWPFAAVAPGSERMRATADAVERALVLPGGGVLRYEGDSYAGGNAWVLAALWLGLYRRQLGDAAGHAAALAYAQRVATALGLLPEQVTDEGAPAWVVPLAWSHAMFVLAARPELAAVSARTTRPSARVRVPR
jgi:GH15 family glucan-1,4-alpha-glucosidase